LPSAKNAEPGSLKIPGKASRRILCMTPKFHFAFPSVLILGENFYNYFHMLPGRRRTKGKVNYVPLFGSLEVKIS